MVWIIIKFLICMLILSYILADIIVSLRDIKCQKKWNEEKAKRMKIDPSITRAELCEYYVMFCLRNDCKVDF